MIKLSFIRSSFVLRAKKTEEKYEEHEMESDASFFITSFYHQ